MGRSTRSHEPIRDVPSSLSRRSRRVLTVSSHARCWPARRPADCGAAACRRRLRERFPDGGVAPRVQGSPRGRRSGCDVAATTDARGGVRGGRPVRTRSRSSRRRHMGRAIGSRARRHTRNRDARPRAPAAARLGACRERQTTFARSSVRGGRAKPSDARELADIDRDRRFRRTLLSVEQLLSDELRQRRSRFRFPTLRAASLRTTREKCGSG